MLIDSKIAEKYWRQAAMEQVILGLEEEGYNLEKNTQLNQIHTDLIARKEDLFIVYQFKTSLSDEEAELDERLRRYVSKQPNGKFKYVWVAPPRDKNIEIENIEELLCEALKEEPPNELDRLSTQTSVEEVSDVFIQEISIRGKEIEIYGFGTLDVTLQWGSQSDQSQGDGIKHTDDFPFEFRVTLDSITNTLIEFLKLDVDVSEFYGQT